MLPVQRRRALEARLLARDACQGRDHASVESLLEDDLFFDALYATLTAWGLHRMGPGNTKLRNLDDIRSSIREQAEHLEQLRPLTITDIADSDIPRIVERVWAVLRRSE